MSSSEPLSNLLFRRLAFLTRPKFRTFGWVSGSRVRLSVEITVGGCRETGFTLSDRRVDIDMELGPFAPFATFIDRLLEGFSLEEPSPFSCDFNGEDALGEPGCRELLFASAKNAVICLPRLPVETFVFFAIIRNPIDWSAERRDGSKTEGPERVLESHVAIFGKNQLINPASERRRFPVSFHA